jgi:FixJ family two-component response regulator
MVEEKATELMAIVDDDESVRDATSSLLRSNGFRAETFSSAEEFLKSPFLTLTGCVLLDIEMPGMSGLELHRRLIGEGWRIPIIYITAHVAPKIRQEAIRAGAAAFLSKPFSEDALFQAIHIAFKPS